MSTQDTAPILLIGALLLAGILYSWKGTDHQTYEGVIVQDFTTYEFYPNAKDCNYSGIPYVLLPDQHFDEVVVSRADINDLANNRTAALFRGTWHAKLNGNLSHLGIYKYRKTYWRELSVNFVLDATPLSCANKKNASQ